VIQFHSIYLILLKKIFLLTTAVTCSTRLNNPISTLISNQNMKSAGDQAIKIGYTSILLICYDTLRFSAQISAMISAFASVFVLLITDGNISMKRQRSTSPPPSSSSSTLTKKAALGPSGLPLLPECQYGSTLPLHHFVIDAIHMANGHVCRC
jgi:hypothetical protein